MPTCRSKELLHQCLLPRLTPMNSIVYPPGTDRELSYNYRIPSLRNRWGTLDFYDQPAPMENGFWNVNVTGRRPPQGDYVVVSLLECDVMFVVTNC